MSENVVSENHPGLVEHTFDTGEVRLGVQLNYAEGPAHGPPLVLLHGLGRRWQVFLPVIPDEWYVPLRDAVERARKTVRELRQWRTIDALAKRLLRDKQISGPDTKAFLDINGCPCPPAKPVSSPLEMWTHFNTRLDDSYPKGEVTLVLEDAPERIAWFRDRVPDAVYVTTAEDAIKALMSQEFRVVFLDHDLHGMHAAENAIVKGTGKEVAMHLKKTGFKGIVVIHSKNEDGARVMLKILPGAKVARFGEFEITAG